MEASSEIFRKMIEGATGTIFVNQQPLPSADTNRPVSSTSFSLGKFDHRLGKFLGNGLFAAVFDSEIFNMKLAAKVFPHVNPYLDELEWARYLDKVTIMNPRKSHLTSKYFVNPVAVGMTTSTPVPFLYILYALADGTYQGLSSTWDMKTRPLELLRAAHGPFASVRRLSIP
eukprot:TRINITY_DN12620_c0_g1_i1.p1 TRINITY_DN12620_c0_g1~~TRINITY_DN12620_c0_g1_i1.p1  ORF type:complete len:194 (-),score=27.69 TRINITY_DN12620_c0_g1_i1:461-976(-)